MGIKTVISDANFSQSAILLDAAVPNGLVFANVFANKQTLINNLIEDAPASKLVGAPTIPNGIARFQDSTSYLQSRVAATQTGTILAVVRLPFFDATTPAYAVGTFGYAGGGGPTLYFAGESDGTGEIPLITTKRGGTNVPTSIADLTPDIDPAAAECWIASWDATSQRLDHPRTGQYGQATGLAACDYVPAQYRIGGSYSGSQRYNEVGVTMIWNRALTADERAAAYAQAKLIMGQLDIVV